MDDRTINNLREELLQFVSKKIDNDTFVSIVKLIRKFVDCEMCSLWRINNNSTGSKSEYKSTSLLVRTLKNGLRFHSENDEDYIHDLNNDCLIKCVLQLIKEEVLSYHLCNIKSCEKCDNTKCIKIKPIQPLRKLNLQYFLSIPIYEQDNKTKTIALLILAFTDEPQISNLEEISSIISMVMSSCFYRNMVYRKQNITQKLVENYYLQGEKKHLRDIFYPILKSILKDEYWPYESASAFIWDSYKNNYKLLSTTDIEGYNDESDYEKIVYNIGEEDIGKVANKKKPKIYDEPSFVAEGKYIEKTENGRKTMMIIPIFRPSKRDEVIGILRFVNNQNKVSKCFTDFFNDTDVDVMKYVADHLALIIDNFLGEEERTAFISKLSHESKTPANAIRVSAERIKRKIGDGIFMRTEFHHYLQSIIDYADIQMTQAEANLLISNFYGNTPKRYVIKRQSIREVIEKSINVVRPYARDRRNISFRNIHIQNDFPDWHLYIDSNVFKIVFYNLLTNAIKYVIPNTPSFQVNISGIETTDHLIINVSDYGLGIEEKDKENIFLLGVRGENIRKKNNEGYGIGLHITQQILKDFGGEIRVSNCLFPTTFEIKLPIKILNNKIIT